MPVGVIQLQLPKGGCASKVPSIRIRCGSWWNACTIAAGDQIWIRPMLPIYAGESPQICSEVSTSFPTVIRAATLQRGLISCAPTFFLPTSYELAARSQALPIGSRISIVGTRVSESGNRHSDRSREPSASVCQAASADTGSSG